MAEKRRPPIVGRYTQEELALASRNSGMPLEAPRYELTPAGLHYLLIHFDIPAADAATWQLRIEGLVSRPQAVSLAELQRIPARTVRVTMECAGNGRAWSGNAPIRRVEFAVDGAWQDAVLDAPVGAHAWRRWTARWNASPGAHQLCCRATDDTGAVQPLEPAWDVTGFGNNAAQQVEVNVR